MWPARLNHLPAPSRAEAATAEWKDLGPLLVALEDGRWYRLQLRNARLFGGRHFLTRDDGSRSYWEVNGYVEADVAPEPVSVPPEPAVVAPPTTGLDRPSPEAFGPYEPRSNMRADDARWGCLASLVLLLLLSMLAWGIAPLLLVAILAALAVLVSLLAGPWRIPAWILCTVFLLAWLPRPCSRVAPLMVALLLSAVALAWRRARIANRTAAAAALLILSVASWPKAPCPASSEPLPVAPETAKARLSEMSSPDRDADLVQQATRGPNKRVSLDAALAQGGLECGQTVHMSGDLLFPVGSAALRPDGIEQLRKLYRMIRLSPDVRVTLVGHADISGEPDRNQALSEARAKSVGGWLLANDALEADHLLLEGKGASEPLVEAAADDPIQRLNRRVDVVVSCTSEGPDVSR